MTGKNGYNTTKGYAIRFYKTQRPKEKYPQSRQLEEEKNDMKGFAKAAIECIAVCIGLWFIIHRRVFAACLTGDTMPEAPEWHKKCFGMHK